MTKTVVIKIEDIGEVDTSFTLEEWENLSHGDKADVLKEAILDKVSAYAYLGDEYLNWGW